MLKLKLQYFGHLMQQADSLGKTLMLGKIEGKRKRGRQMDMNLSKLQKIVEDRGVACYSPLSRWCHSTISSSVTPFSSCLQSFPASGSFPISWFFASGGQSIGVSASTSILPMNIQDWFPLGLLVGSPCSPRDSQESSRTPPQHKSINSLALNFLCSPTLTTIHDYWKNHSFD